MVDEEEGEAGGAYTPQKRSLGPDGEGGLDKVDGQKDLSPK